MAWLIAVVRAAGICQVLACQIQRGAVVHRGTDEGKSEGDVDRVAKALVFEHGQP